MNYVYSIVDTFTCDTMISIHICTYDPVVYDSQYLSTNIEDVKRFIGNNMMPEIIIYLSPYNKETIALRNELFNYHDQYLDLL